MFYGEGIRYNGSTCDIVQDMLLCRFIGLQQSGGVNGLDIKERDLYRTSTKRQRDIVMHRLLTHYLTGNLHDFVYLTNVVFKDFGFDYSQAILALTGMGYLEIVDGGNGVLYGLDITQKGLYYFEEQRDAFRKFVRQSVLIPIVLAIIATLLTNYALPGASTSQETSTPIFQVEVELPQHIIEELGDRIRSLPQENTLPVPGRSPSPEPSPTLLEVASGF